MAPATSFSALAIGAAAAVNVPHAVHNKTPEEAKAKVFINARTTRRGTYSAPRIDERNKLGIYYKYVVRRIA